MSFRSSLSTGRAFVFGAALLSLTLTGFGCKKETLPRLNTAAWPNGRVQLPTLSVDSAPTQPTPIVRQPDVEWKNDPNLIRVRAAMSQLNQSDTYRATLHLGGTGVIGDIAYNRKYGIYGTLTTQHGVNVDIAIQGNRVAVRDSTSTWQDVSDTPEGDQVQNLFSSLLNQQKNEVAFPTGNARYASQEDDQTRGCHMYHFRQFMGDRGFQPLQVCLKDGLPSYFSLQTADGLVEIEYRDVDKPVEVFFPLP